MKLKIPPVVIVFLIGISMWGVNYLTGLSIDFTGKAMAAKIVLTLCVVVLIFALYAFRKLKTTVDPMNPDKASKLVTIGIYAITRNPMYLAMLLLLLGWSIKLANPLNLLLLILFIWFMNQFQIKPEEEALTKIFGKEYLAYCKKVRRWI